MRRKNCATTVRIATPLLPLSTSQRHRETGTLPLGLVGRSSRLRFGLRRHMLRLALNPALRRLDAARVAPGIDGPLVGDAAERSLVGALGVAFQLKLIWGLVLVLFAVTLHGLLLGPGRSGQRRDNRRGNESSHAHSS